MLLLFVLATGSVLSAESESVGKETIAPTFVPELEPEDSGLIPGSPIAYIDQLSHTTQGTLRLWAPHMLGFPAGPNNSWFSRLFLVWYGGSWYTQSYGNMPLGSLVELIDPDNGYQLKVVHKGRSARIFSQAHGEPQFGEMAQADNSLFALSPPPVHNGRMPVAPMAGMVADLSLMTAAPDPFIAISARLFARGPRSFELELTAHGAPRTLRPFALKLRSMLMRDSELKVKTQFELLPGAQNLRLVSTLHGRDELALFVERLYYLVRPR